MKDKPNAHNCGKKTKMKVSQEMKWMKGNHDKNEYYGFDDMKIYWYDDMIYGYWNHLIQKVSV